MSNVISIDGPKGSGKTTVTNLLKKRLPGAIVLSLEEIRRAIPDAIPTEEFNIPAFKTLLQRVVECLDLQKDIIIDSDLTDERAQALKEAIRDAFGTWRPYALTASRETLLKRVKQRDQELKRHTNQERFERAYERQQQKSFEGMTLMDTETMSAEEVAEQIMTGLKG